MVGDRSAELLVQVGAGDETRCDHHGVDLDLGAVLEHHGTDLLAVRSQFRDGAVDDPHVARLELVAGLALQGGRRVGEEGDVVAELTEQQGLVHAHRPRRDHADAPVPNLPAVAVRAVQDTLPPQFADSGQVGQLVDQSRREDQSTCLHGGAAGETDLESRVAATSGFCSCGKDFGAVSGGLLPSESQQFGRRDAFVSDHVVRGRGRGVARFSGIDDKHRAA